MQPKTLSDAGGESLPASSRFSLPVRVYYEDTDAGGVVYYANYLKFCERTRTEWLRALGVAQQAPLVEQGLGFVVRSVRADSPAPARLDDALEVGARIASRRRASLVFDHEIRRDGELVPMRPGESSISAPGSMGSNGMGLPFIRATVGFSLEGNSE